ncbi:MAG: N-acetylmuramoyl-L-alanine amidase [Kordiimonadaceae bacterium]|nr:N-acetylmuramoyl-L-alanine amidase [Kordiimonadaceae bacterium]
MKVVKSPNYNERSDAGIKYLIMHYTGMASGAEALIRLCDAKSEVADHYLIEENGEVYSLVDESHRAWHSGVSKWEDDEDINDRSIGIELVNPGHPYPGYESDYVSFPGAQMESLISLSQEIIGRHKIKPWHVLGHSDVAWRRKIDPGELFDWKMLSENGVGCWPKRENDNIEVSSEHFLTGLKFYGYSTEGCHENQTEIISAFQRHFRQSNFSGVLDSETMGILMDLLKQKIS